MEERMAEIASAELREVIEKHLKKFGERYREGDTEGLAQLYTEDVVLWITNVVCGREAIQKDHDELIASGVKDMDLAVGEVYQWGNRLVEITQCTFLDTAGQAIREVKYIEIWKQEQDQWKPCLLIGA
jgi:ketosteroid isomerase-like protein